MSFVVTQTSLKCTPRPTQILLESAYRVATVRQHRDRLGPLESLRPHDLIQASFRFGIKGLHESKALTGGGPVVGGSSGWGGLWVGKLGYSTGISPLPP